jgi:hypothetical protein
LNPAFTHSLKGAWFQTFSLKWCDFLVSKYFASNFVPLHIQLVLLHIQLVPLQHGAHAGEDGSDALASKLGGGLLRWLSNEASVGGCYSCCAQCV